jgi:tRNA(fMet)-specific endonuclease VapC
MDSNPNVLAKFDEFESAIYLCSIVHSECLFGALNKNNLKFERFYTSLFNKFGYYVYGKKESKNFATIKSYLQKSGKIVGDFDIMIAAIALANNLTLVTNNIKDFANIKDLKLEDWSK